MKKIIIYFIILLLLFSCKTTGSEDNLVKEEKNNYKDEEDSKSDNTNTENESVEDENIKDNIKVTDSLKKVDYIIIVNQSRSNEITNSRLQGDFFNLAAAYIYGKKYIYVKHSLIKIIKNKSIDAEDIKKVITNRKILNLDTDYIVEMGEIYFFKIIKYSQNKIVTGKLSVTGSKNVYWLYNKLEEKAITEYTKPGSTGYIFPYGDIGFTFENNNVTITQRFIITEE